MIDMRASPSFLSWVRGYNWRQLCSGYLKMETFKEISQAAAENPLISGKFPVFSGLTWTALFHFGGTKDMVSALLSQLTRLDPGNFPSLPSAGTPNLLPFPSPSSCFCTSLCGAYGTGSLTTLSALGTIGPSSHAKYQGKKSIPLHHALQVLGAHWHLW